MFIYYYKGLFMFFNKLFIRLFLVLLVSFVSLFSYTENNLVDNLNKLGDKNAENILVEYASLSCVHCANFHNNELPEIKKNLIDSGKLKFIYKDFPLDKSAMQASMIAHCFSGDQYFEVLSSLYRNQKKWVSEADNSGNFYNSLHSILKIHDITLEKVINCIDTDKGINQKKWDSILSTRLEGQKIGVNSTPTFFLNGKKIEKPVNYDTLNKLIK